MSTKRIIILGSGFGGVKCAETLREEPALDQAGWCVSAASTEIVFGPLLAEVACFIVGALDSTVTTECGASRMPLQDANRCRKKPEREFPRLGGRAAVKDIRFSRTVMSMYRLSRGVPLAYEDKTFQDGRSWSR
jgi:hypothetical protein